MNARDLNTFVYFYSVQSPQRTCINKKQQRQQNSVMCKQPLDRPRGSRASLVNCDSRVLRNHYRQFHMQLQVNDCKIR